MSTFNEYMGETTLSHHLRVRDDADRPSALASAWETSLRGFGR